jgi:hypothetical protein
MLATSFGNTARFGTRSEGSARHTDLTMVMQVIDTVERALNASKSERGGLDRRVFDVLSSASMLVGNGTNEVCRAPNCRRQPIEGI